MNNEIKLFLSSTFDKKMHARRDYFKNEISAHLNKIVGQVGTNIFLYDYELGIPDKTPPADVLNVCFEKVDICDYFIAIIDEKYGTEINKQLECITGISEKYQKLVNNGLVENLSVLELEIIRALENKQKKKLFFIRKGSENSTLQIQNLIHRIKSNVDSDNIIYFSRNSEILRVLENHFEKEVRNDLEKLTKEQRNRNLMYANKMRYYVDDRITLKTLNDYVDDNNDKVLILSGKSGSGKSTLLLNWLEQHYGDKEKNIISCFVDIDGYTVSDVFRKLNNQSCEKPVSKIDDKQDEISILDSFIPFTHSLSENYKKNIIVLDGLDQINFTNERKGDAAKYYWLNEVLPPNVKVIISTTDDKVDKNKFKVHQIATYSLSELSKYHLEKEGKELLYPSFKKFIDFENKTIKNIPIIARLICSEICMTANHKNVSQSLKKYNKQLLEGKDIVDLYEGFLKRISKREIMKDDALSEICRYLYCSECGLDKETLSNLFTLHRKNKKSQVEFFTTFLYHDLRTDVDGRMEFSHSYFKQAVKKLYMQSSLGLKSHREDIISVLENKSSTKHTLAECAYQIDILKSKDKMFKLISDIDNARELYYLNRIRFTMYSNIFTENEKNNLFNSYENTSMYEFTTENIHFLASYYKEIYNFSKSLEYHNILLKKITQFGKQHLNIASTWNNIALLYKDNGQYKESLTFYKKALSIRESKCGKNHPDTAEIYNNLGEILELQGKYQKALNLYFKTVAIRENKHQEVSNLAATYGNIGIVYNKMGKYDLSLDYHQKSLTIRESLLGSSHPNTANSYSNKAVVYYWRGDYDKALEWHTKALNIRKKVFGRTHPETAYSYNNIGVVYYKLCNYIKAIDYYKKALSIREKILSKRHPNTINTYNNIAEAYRGQGEYSTALELFKELIVLCIQEYGKTHPYTASSYNNIAQVYRNMEQYNTALKWYEKSLSILKKEFNNEHPNIASTYNNIGQTHERLNNFDKALYYYVNAYTMRTKLIKNHPETIATYNNLVIVFNKITDNQKTSEWYIKAKAILGEYNIIIG